MQSLDARDDPGNSFANAFVRILEKKQFPGKSAGRLARAVIAQLQASGFSPHSEEALEEFYSKLAPRLNCVIHPEDEDRAFLEGLDNLIGAGPIPTWANDLLRELDWRDLYDNLDLNYVRFRTQADELGLKPAAEDRIRDRRTLSFASLPEELKAAVLDDEDCRRLWLEKLTAGGSEIREIYYDEFLRAATAAGKLARVVHHLPSEVALSEDVRPLVLRDQPRLIGALDAYQRFSRAFERPASPALRVVLRDLHIRGTYEPNAGWGRLDPLGDSDFIELLKYWSFVVARTYSDVDAPPQYRPMEPQAVLRSYCAILGELVRRGAGVAHRLAHAILANDVDPSPGKEDWRPALVDLQTLVTEWVFRRMRRGSELLDGGESPAGPVLSEWFHLKCQLDELLATGFRTILASEAGVAGRVIHWLEMVNSERGPIRDTAACIVRWALAGLAGAGKWSDIEPLIERLSGKFEPHLRFRATLNHAVAGIATKEEHKKCEEFLLKLLARADIKPPYLPIEMACSFGMKSAALPDEVLSSPGTAELSSLGKGWYPPPWKPDTLVALARPLKGSPKILEALINLYCALAREIRICPAGSESTEIDLGELLFATGDLRLNPPQPVGWPRSWRHVLEWHLGAGNGIEEYFRDIWSPHHPKDSDTRYLPVQVDPMRIFACQESLINETPDADATEVVRTELARLEAILSSARLGDSIPSLHPGWREYTDLGPWAEKGGEFIDLALDHLPKRRVAVLDRSYRRILALAHSDPARDVAWPMFAELAVLLADHPAYSGLVTADTRAELVEGSKQTLVGLRRDAARVSIGASAPRPVLEACVAVLCAFQDYATALRQLLLIYRELPVPALPPSLDPREASKTATAWSEVPECVTRLVANSPRDQRDGIRFALADYLQERLKPRKPGTPAGVTVRPEEDASRVEVNRYLREAYVEALADLRTDRGGRLHRLLGNVVLDDPSPEVQEAARRCAARARKVGKEAPRGSLGRVIMNGWWWVRFGTNRRFGAEHVDSGSARVTRIREATQLRGESEMM